MACQTCRSQTRGLLRSALRAGVAAPAPSPASRTVATAVAQSVAAPTSQRASRTAVRTFTSSAQRQLLGSSLRDSYRVVGASERLFKVCAKPADYHITDEERKKDLVQKRDDGEEIGKAVDPENVWHKSTST